MSTQPNSDTKKKADAQRRTHTLLLVAGLLVMASGVLGTVNARAAGESDTMNVVLVAAGALMFVVSLVRLLRAR